MSDETLKTRWRATATNAFSLSPNYEPGNDVLAVEDSDINVKEISRSVDMDNKPNEKAYGIPINAKLAVALIADLQSRLREKVNNFNNFLEDEDVREDLEWLKNLLIHSSAITMDKNIILKTLSQPGCEGVRFYLCRKTIGDEKQPFFSLVTVGVNKKGEDLFYEYSSETLKLGLKAAQLEDVSLLSEYSSPPPPETILNETRFTEIDPKKFPILRYALDESENVNTARAKHKKK